MVLAREHTSTPAHVRALGAHVVNDRANFAEAVPSDDEREHLASTLGKALRDMRADRGLSTRSLAERSALARSTVRRLESGERRPRPVVLEAIAYGLDHKAPEPLCAVLREAAGASLRPDTPAGRRRHARRLRNALRAAELRRARVYRAAAAMSSAWLGVITSSWPEVTASFVNDAEAMDAAIVRMDRANALADRLEHGAKAARSWLREAEHPLDLQRIRYAESSIDYANQ